MAGRHAHHGAHTQATPRWALGVVGAALLVVVAAMVWLWPSDTATRDEPGPTQVNGVVGAVNAVTCPGASNTEALGQGSGPGQCGTAAVQLSEGAGRGRVVTARLPGVAGAPTVEVGDAVVLAVSPDNPEDQRYAVIDHQRGRALWVLGIAFALAIVAFGRVRGLMALLGLAFTFAVLLTFVIPAVLAGSPPVLVAVVGCAAIALVVLYLTHGTGMPITVALVGTVVSLVVTGALSAVSVRAMHLTGGGDESSYILGQVQGVDLRGLLLAGMMIGTLGVLDDVTVTQAVTVEELAAANPGYTSRQLYAAGMRVGRAHISSVINTIILAYASASLPLFVLLVALDDPIGQTLSDQLVATELVRSGVGTLGLIAAVPITTLAAAVVHVRRASKSAPARSGEQAMTAH
jgi:uncharacterized membrane protein